MMALRAGKEPGGKPGFLPERRIGFPGLKNDILEKILPVGVSFGIKQAYFKDKALIFFNKHFKGDNFFSTMMLE